MKNQYGRPLQVSVAIVTIIAFGAQLPGYAGSREEVKVKATSAQIPLYAPPQYQSYLETRDTIYVVKEDKKKEAAHGSEKLKQAAKGAVIEVLEAVREVKESIEKKLLPADRHDKDKKDKKDKNDKKGKKENSHRGHHRKHHQHGGGSGAGSGSGVPVVVPPLVVPPVVEPPVAAPPVVVPPVAEPPVVVTPDPTPTPPPASTLLNLATWTVAQQVVSPEGIVMATTYTPPAGTASDYLSIRVMNDPSTGQPFFATAVKYSVQTEPVDLIDVTLTDATPRADGLRVETYISNDGMREYTVHYDVLGNVTKTETKENVFLSMDMIQF